MKLSLFVLLVSAVLLALLMGGCKSMTWKGSIGYSGEYGDYSIGSDGKSVTTDVRIRNRDGHGLTRTDTGFAK